jgi:hypothetical protein
VTGGWWAAFDRVWHDPSAAGDVACPVCGEVGVHFVYVMDDLADERGMPALWCGACLTGLPPGTGPVPLGAVRVRRGSEQIPNYRAEYE